MMCKSQEQIADSNYLIVKSVDLAIDLFEKIEYYRRKEKKISKN